MIDPHGKRHPMHTRAQQFLRRVNGFCLPPRFSGGFKKPLNPAPTRAGGEGMLEARQKLPGNLMRNRSGCRETERVHSSDAFGEIDPLDMLPTSVPS